ncbi:MAG: hypothetical protein ACFE85_13775 [Candidatus Hodarchaeota archaeon]
MNKYKVLKWLSYFFLVLILSLNISNLFQVSKAQAADIYLNQSISANMMEYADIEDSLESNSSIKIPLTLDTWNVTSLELNFADIKLDREIKTIEDNTTVGFKFLNKEVKGLGVQVKLTEETTIFGVQIYGAAPVMKGLENIFVQVRGYGVLLDRPNDTIFASTLLNMSQNLGWYDQIFENPVSLQPGNYYFVLNGSSLTGSDETLLYWFYNYLSPTYPLLYISEMGKLDVWRQGVIGSPFLHKLVQRVNRTYYPESINMTAEVNNEIYNITDGFEIGKGNLTVNEIDFSPNNNYLDITIRNNNSIELYFNLSYEIGLKNAFLSGGNLLIKQSSDNNWTLTPDISRISNNYTVKFEYPKNWFDFLILRNGQDITSQINITSDYIIIPNETITVSSDWVISAQSTNVEISLDVPKVAYEPDQALKFSVLPPVLPGNLTYILYDPFDYPEHIEEIEIQETTSEEIVLSYILSSNPNEGTYKAAIFWNNNSAAGLKTQTFYVNIDIFPILVILSMTLGIVAAVSGYTSYKLIKRVKKQREGYRKSIYNRYMDILNLDYIMVLDKEAGINVYDQILASKKINPTLISGFLQAIRSFGIDLTGSNTQSQTIRLEYQDSKILMSEFKNFRMTLIMKENPSQDFLDSINVLSYDIDEKFGKFFQKFDGEISKFEGIKELIENRLPLKLIYPLKIDESMKIKMNQAKKVMINKAKEIMKKNNTNHFYVSQLFSLKEGFQVKDADIILELINKEIFQAIGN